MRCRISPVLFLLLATSLSFAQASYRLKTRTAAEYSAAQRQVVGSYCRLEFEGSRLSDAGWQKLRPLVTYRSNPDFNVVEIISRYQIAPSQGMSSPYVTVSYNVIGRFEVGYGYTPAPAMREVLFRAEDKAGEVVITDIDPNVPRASKAAVVQWLKTQLTKSPNDIAKAQIEKALQVLDPPAATPAASAQPAENPGTAK